ncbi:MAG: TonB-dependent receptor [Proteobacteria bacterium]|nr:TonB-dependent receptor [Pseudomonadota bacterium]
MASNSIRFGFKRSVLTVALGLCFAGGVHAQATSGSIYGTVPAGATVTIRNDAGFTRTITADSQGRYTASSLPVGSYTVTSGDSRREVVVTPGAGANVSFVSTANNSGNTLGTITVTAHGAPAIDVTQTDTRTVVTAAQLKRLPIARSAEAIALLSPGAVGGNGTFFGNDVSFGGSSVAENAYYLNGYFSGNPITNVGGFQLPYGSIEQQETYTGGYGAKYGRSDGGVISQVGKSGSNTFHFGGQIVYGPKSLVETNPDTYYNPPALPADTPYGSWSYLHPARVGQMYSSGKNNLTWGNTYSGYVSGPLIKDKLFAFLSYETTLDHTTTAPVTPLAAPSQLGTKSSSRDPKMYLKVNWNINDKNLLEYTFVGEKYRQSGDTYNYDWNSKSFLGKSIPDTSVQEDNRFHIVKYTGYLTDKLTLTALYGRSTKKYNTDPYLTGLPLINAGDGDQDPAITGGATLTNLQQTQNAVKNTTDTTDGYRIELEYVLGRHTLSAGIDNTNLKGENEGQSQVADVWTYSYTGDNVTPVNAGLGVGPANNAGGYYVSRDKYFDTTTMKLKQQAWYLEDRWQVTDRLLLSIGIRNDKFQNFSDAGVRFVDSKAQWEPRLGFSWDAFGDSTFKVFGNAGRYFLAMPNAVAIRGVGRSTYTSEYFTYTGIDANGVPTGLTPIQNLAGTGPAGPVSADGETGAPKDPLAYVPKDIKSEYQDEFVLGFQANLTRSWTIGAKLTHRDLKSAIDDVCDSGSMIAAAGMTVDPNNSYADNLGNVIGTDSAGNHYAISGCYIFNPGGSNTYSFAQINQDVNGQWQMTGNRKNVKIASGALGPGMDVLKRKYNALDLFLEHPFDGKWEARIDYTFSRSTGNSEGPANSDTGQGSDSHDNGVGTSQNYDAWQIMAFADGYLPNDRTHVLKAHGSYAITPEWMVGASATIASGAPISCFGLYDPDGSIDHNSPDADPIGYGDSYHTCLGQSWTPGKTRTPWTHTYDLNVTWKPAFLQHKMAVSLNVFNVGNKRTPTSVYAYSESSPYQMRERLFQPRSYTTPRYVQLSVSYDY